MYLFVVQIDMTFKLFAILQKYEFSSKSQHYLMSAPNAVGCLRYCKSTSFQANHNQQPFVVVVEPLFAILQKYEFSSKSQQDFRCYRLHLRCLRYCKSTSFQANHNLLLRCPRLAYVVCDTAKVRVFKQITTSFTYGWTTTLLFAILQKYEFSSKSQLIEIPIPHTSGCLRYCKSTSFQANHNARPASPKRPFVVCDTAKVRVFKQITTSRSFLRLTTSCLRYCKSTSFQANHNTTGW